MINADELTHAVAAAFDLALAPWPPGDSGDFPEWQVVSDVFAALSCARNTKVIGISGSQGSGKSTLAKILGDTLRARHVAAAACSLDDFYLTRQERAALAQNVHPLLQTRGVPGTHDWLALAQVLDTVHTGGGVFTLPQFDKGTDDRVGEVATSADVLILEGWCVGVTPQPEHLLARSCNRLEAEEDQQGVWRSWVNRQIAEHYVALWARVDLWIHLRVPGFAQVVEWRTQQERQLSAELRMDPIRIDRFIQHYERLTRWQWQEPAPGPGLVVTLGAAHDIMHITVENGSLGS